MHEPAAQISSGLQAGALLSCHACAGATYIMLHYQGAISTSAVRCSSMALASTAQGPG